MANANQNFFVPGGGTPSAWAGNDAPPADVNVPLGGGGGGRPGQYAPSPQQGRGTGDRQDFDGVHLVAEYFHFFLLK